MLLQTDGSTFLVIGDVSGKGLRAAMTGALAIGALRTLAAENLRPAALLPSVLQAWRERAASIESEAAVHPARRRSRLFKLRGPGSSRAHLATTHGRHLCGYYSAQISSSVGTRAPAGGYPILV